METIAETKKVKVQLISKFKPILEQKHTYYFYHSGRGCGKSRNIAIALVMLSVMQKLNFLVIRDSEENLMKSVYKDILQVVDEMGLKDMFRAVGKKIICKATGSEFVFMGIQDHNAENVKSISNINITFVEEAQSIGKYALELLIPSVLRQNLTDENEITNDLEKGKIGKRINSIIFALNPRFKEDAVWDYFMEHGEVKGTYYCKLTQDDNTFFKNTLMQQAMENDKQILDEKTFANKWLGELLDYGDSLFSSKAFNNMLTGAPLQFERDDYIRLVIGCDPAMTSNNDSNEYGISVVGLKRSGEMVMIENATDKHDPNSFAEKVCDLYSQYRADEIVVETNQGGDFIKSMILGVNPLAVVAEVRAIKDKVTRASPVAALASNNRIKLMEFGRDQLVMQMKKMTLKGYTEKKASPDALDAFTWAVFRLADVGYLQDENSFFLIEDFIDETNDYAFIDNEFNVFYSEGNEVFKARIQVCATLRCAAQFRFCELEKIGSRITQEMLSNEMPNLLPDDEFNWGLDNATFYAKEKLTLDEQAEYIREWQKENEVKIDVGRCKGAVYKNMNGNLAEYTLRRFKLGVDKKNPILSTIFYALKAI